MDLWSPFGFANQAGQGRGTLVSGPHLHWAASRGPTLKAWPSLTGRATDPDSPITPPDPEILYSCRTVTLNRKTGQSSLRLRVSTLIFHCGHRTGPSSTSSKVRSQTSWTSGGSVRLAERPKGLPRTMGASVTPSCWIVGRCCTSRVILTVRDRGSIAWTWNGAFPIG